MENICQQQGPAFNTGRWTRQEHQRFLKGTSPNTQDSNSMAAIGNKFKSWSELGTEHRSDLTPKNTSLETARKPLLTPSRRRLRPKHLLTLNPHRITPTSWRE